MNPLSSPYLNMQNFLQKVCFLFLAISSCTCSYSCICSDAFPPRGLGFFRSCVLVPCLCYFGRPSVHLLLFVAIRRPSLQLFLNTLAMDVPSLYGHVAPILEQARSWFVRVISVKFGSAGLDLQGNFQGGSQEHLPDCFIVSFPWRSFSDMTPRAPRLTLPEVCLGVLPCKEHEVLFYDYTLNKLLA